MQKTTQPAEGVHRYAFVQRADLTRSSRLPSSRQGCCTPRESMDWKTWSSPVRIVTGIHSENDLLMFKPGDILEMGAFWSIRTKDVPSFDRYFSQLQTFYNDYRSR